MRTSLLCKKSGREDMNIKIPALIKDLAEDDDWLISYADITILY